MRRVLLLAAVMGTALLVVGVAGAGNGTPYTRAYGPVFGYWSCTGTHVANKKHVFDNETCVISQPTGDWVTGTFKNNDCGGQANAGDFPPFSGLLNRDNDCALWQSDFDGVSIADSWTITVSDNGDGTFTAKIHASYPLS